MKIRYPKKMSRPEESFRNTIRVLVAGGTSRAPCVCPLACVLRQYEILLGSGFTLWNSLPQISPSESLLAAQGFKWGFSARSSPGCGLPWEHGRFGVGCSEPLMSLCGVWTPPKSSGMEVGAVGAPVLFGFAGPPWWMPPRWEVITRPHRQAAARYWNPILK